MNIETATCQVPFVYRTSCQRPALAVNAWGHDDSCTREQQTPPRDFSTLSETTGESDMQASCSRPSEPGARSHLVTLQGWMLCPLATCALSSVLRSRDGPLREMIPAGARRAPPGGPFAIECQMRARPAGSVRRTRPRRKGGGPPSQAPRAPVVPCWAATIGLAEGDDAAARRTPAAGLTAVKPAGAAARGAHGRARARVGRGGSGRMYPPSRSSLRPMSPRARDVGRRGAASGGNLAR